MWFDTYRFRSAYSPALTTNFTFSEKNTFGDDPEAMEWLKKMCNEYIKVRPYLSEDIYPLTIPGTTHDTWSAVQYHDPKKKAGVIQVFRRSKSPYEEAVFELGGLNEEKTYSFDDADGESFNLDGKHLCESGFRVKIKEKRASKLYFYKEI